MKALELDVRKQIYKVVSQSPGSHFRELQRLTDLSVGSLRYHLTYLTKHDLITEEKDDKNVRYFSKEFTVSNKKLMSLLRQKSIRTIILFILLNPNCNHEDIVKEVKLSPSTVSWHTKKLEDCEILASIKRGRRTYYSLITTKEEIMNMLITYHESFLDAMVDRVIELWDVT